MTTEFSSLLARIVITGAFYLIVCSIIRRFYPPEKQTPVREEGISLLYSVIAAVCAVFIGQSIDGYYSELSSWQSISYTLLSFFPFALIDLFIERAITKKQKNAA